VRAGEAIVEPPNVAIFYVSTPDTPFLDSLHH
jgi:hypothetical protein